MAKFILDKDSHFVVAIKVVVVTGLLVVLLDILASIQTPCIIQNYALMLKSVSTLAF